MAITSTEEAKAVQMLLDYYLRGGSTLHAQAQDAWMQLADAARDHYGIGWRPAEVAEKFRPRGEDGPDPNDEEPDDCEACLDANGDCRFHRGALFGFEKAMAGAAAALTVFARDPEQIDGLIERDERNQRAEREHQARDQVSPIGGGITEHEKKARDAHRIVTDWWLGDETSARES